MAVFRVQRTTDYTVMSNYHLRDKNLTLKSKGLLSMMLSLRDDWNYTTRGLAAISKEGVDAIGTALKELEIAGYITRHQLRGDNGRICDTEYTIYERPQHQEAPPDTDSPDTENPYLDKPDTVSPCLENPAELNTKKSNTQATLNGFSLKGKDRSLSYRSSRHCGNVCNRPDDGAVGNAVCWVWESLDFSMPCKRRFPSVEWPVSTFP